MTAVEIAKVRENYFNPDGTLNELARKLISDMKDRAIFRIGLAPWNEDPQANEDRLFLLQLISAIPSILK